MKSLFFFSFILFSGACATHPLLQPSLYPKSEFDIEQAKILSPDESQWILMRKDFHNLVFGKKFKDTSQTALMSAMMYTVEPKKTTRAFLEFIAEKRRENDNQERFKVLSVKNDFVDFKGLPCMKYQTLSEDHQSAAAKSKETDYFKTSGYICRYPFEYVAFQVEISHRSKSKEIPDDLLKLSQSFFDNIQLVEPTIKKLKSIP